MEIAGDRPPRYDEKTVLEPSRGKPSRMRVWPPRPPALRDIETRGLSYREEIKTWRAFLPNALKYETPSSQIKCGFN